MTSRLSLLADLLSLWHERLRTWAADGRLAEAVQLALQGSAASPVLDSLLSRWQQGDFSDLPSVHVLDHALLEEALGAYGNGQILLNRQWLEASSNTQLFTVLTEELGHHLDHLLNPSNDTPGDEGELFARLLLNPTSLDGPTLARIQAETDQRILRTPEGPIAMELADNTAPTAVQLSSTNINEGEAAGAVVGNLASVDANSGDTFTYTLVSGSGSDDNGAFSINQYNQLVANSSLDREQKASYKVRVRSTDTGGLFTEQAFVITVNNLQDPIKLKDLGSISLTSQANSTTLDLSTYFDDPFSTGQVAKFTLNPALQKAIASSFPSIPALQAKTSIDVVLFDQSGAGAPLSAANLAQYVNAGRYADTMLHRLVPGFVIQGGGFTWADGAASPSQVTTFPNLQNEYNSNRANIRGTVAMAKLGGDPNSATSQWFFNLANNTANLDNQNGGFTVIGRTRNATDLTLMDILSVADRVNAGNVFSELPTIGLTASSTSIAPNNTLRFSNISIEKQNELSYTIVSNSRPDRLAASLNNNSLVLNRLSGTSSGADTANLVVRATNLWGESVDQTLVVSLPVADTGQPLNQPKINQLTSKNNDGTYRIGSTITVDVIFSEAVKIEGQAPTLLLETGAIDRTATYTSSSSDGKTLSFSYSVQEGDSSTDLDAASTNALKSPPGSSIKALTAGTGGVEIDANLTLPVGTNTAGSLANSKTLALNGARPTVAQLTSRSTDGTYRTGSTITVDVIFSEAVKIEGQAPTLLLETGAIDRTATYTSSSSDGKTLSFSYSVQEGDSSTDLDGASTNALQFPQSSSIKALNSGAGGMEVAANINLPVGSNTASSLSAGKNLIIGDNGAVFSPDRTQAQAGSSVFLPIHLNSKVLGATANGLQLAVHYDSSKLNFTGFDAVLAGQVGEAQDQVDSGNSDSDPSTDRLIKILWSSNGNPFPGVDSVTGQVIQSTVPLGMLRLRTASSFSGDTLVRFRSAAGTSGSDFSSSAPATITSSAVPWNLDIDADGRFDPRVDGPLLLQLGLGTFPGTVQTGAASSPLSLRGGSLDIRDHLKTGLSSNALDIDGNGLFEPLIDGLLAINYGLDTLTADTFAAQPLGTGASRTSFNSVSTYLNSLMP